MHRISILATTLFFALALPSFAAAANPGDLIKLADDKNPATQVDSAVYYLGFDGNRYAFPNAQTYATWYASFSSVRIVSATELASYRLGGNVTYRPGTRLVKIQSDPKVYAVEPGGVLRGIGSEAVAAALYGSAWNTRIDDVADTSFINYTVGSPLDTAAFPSGSVVRRTTDNVLFYIENGAKRLISTDAIRTSLRLRDEHILASASLSDYPDGAPVASGEGAITDASGKGTVSADAPPKFTSIVPSTTVIGVGTDATFMTLGYVAGGATTVTKLTVRLDSLTDKDTVAPDTDDGGLIFRNGPTANITDIRFIDDSGVEVFGRKNLNVAVDNDDAQSLVFVGRWDVPAGTYRTLRLVGHTSDLVPKDEGYRATLVVSGTGVERTGASAAFSPATDLAGPSLKTSADDFTVTVATGGGGTAVRGAKNVDINGFSFKATATQSNIVRSLRVQGYIDEQEGVTGFLAGSDADNGTKTYIDDIVGNLNLYTSTGAFLAGPVELDSNGIATFDGLSILIPAGATSSVMIRGDLRVNADLELHPDKIAFDIVDAFTDVAVTNADGVTVRAAGKLPNGGTAAGRAVTVRKNGTLEAKWEQASGTAMAGTEVLLGTLRLEGEYEAFSLQTVAFIQPDGASASLDSLRLSYGSGAAAVSKTVDFIGDTATFTGLAVPVPVGDMDGISVKVYGVILPQSAGASYGESIKLKPSTGGPFTFIAGSNGEVLDAAAFPTSGDFAFIRGGTSSFTVRFSQLSTSLVSGSVPTQSYRGVETEILRFTFAAGASGPVRVREFSFKLVPSDKGRGGADNDALERWADLSGDFVDDDLVGSVRRVLADGLDDPFCEGPNGRFTYRVFSGSSEVAAPSSHTSTSSDYGVITCDLSSGREFFIPAGGSATFVLQINTDQLAEDKDYTLDVSLLSGAGYFAYTDITSGAYTDITSSGGSITARVTLRR